MIPAPFVLHCADYGLTLTPGQRVLGAVCFDRVDFCELPEDERPIARELFGAVDRVPPTVTGEIVCWVKGARIGGSRMAAMRLYQLAHVVDLHDLAPGESAFGLIVGPDLRLARQCFAYVQGAARADAARGRLSFTAESADAFTFERHDGKSITIQCLPASVGGSAVRGRTLVGAIMTEAAFFRDSNFVINDTELYRALAPRIVRGGQLILESTPWAQQGLLYEFWRDNFGHPTTALVAHCPTLLMRPDAQTRALVERERRRDPDNAECEYDAQFRTTGSDQFFGTFEIDASMRGGFAPRPQVGTRLFAAGDLGLTSDSSALAIVSVSLVDRRLVLHELIERRPEPNEPLKLSSVIRTFAEALRGYGIYEFTADGWSLEAAREHATVEGISIRRAPAGRDGKTRVYLASRDALREGRVQLPDHPRLRAQLRAVVSKAVPGGGIAISSPRRSGHGDLVSALVLALWLADGGGVPDRAHGGGFQTNGGLERAPASLDGLDLDVGGGGDGAGGGGDGARDDVGLARQLAHYIDTIGGSR